MMKTFKFWNLVILALVSLQVKGSPGGESEGKKTIRLVVPFNNCVTDSSLTAGPGFSMWIEYGDKIILFDTGSNYQLLLENMTKKGLNFQQVNDIFISHNHWDHLYGIPGIAGARNFSVNTFIPKSSVEAIIQQVPRLKYSAVDSLQQLYPGIWSTGELKSKFLNTTIAEQSLILEQTDGLVVIVGCSHSGIEMIIEKIKVSFPGKAIKLLVGGLHLEKKTTEELQHLSDYLKKEGVKSIAPSHCTGDAAVSFFQKEWGAGFIHLYLGDEYKIE